MTRTLFILAKASKAKDRWLFPFSASPSMGSTPIFMRKVTTFNSVSSLKPRASFFFFTSSSSTGKSNLIPRCPSPPSMDFRHRTSPKSSSITTISKGVPLGRLSLIVMEPPKRSPCLILRGAFTLITARSGGGFGSPNPMVCTETLSFLS